MDHCVLNQHPYVGATQADGAVVRGEHVMAGGFMPQFGITGGSHYGSIFSDDLLQQQVQQGPNGGYELRKRWAGVETAQVTTFGTSY